MLRHRRNVNLSEEKLRILELAFAKFEQAHTSYIDAVDNSEEMQVATIGFDSEFQRLDILINSGQMTLVRGTKIFQSTFSFRWDFLS